ncbi:MAG: hypothetical protein FD165_832 [Gammaproteobacteria bacterium]|nr:MAG: hypothetical protein FD165_832 [Gammaproteobacteria bacterium]TND06459.1 MAG: hypothetical protein FD120_946 [Gammaproteobacteria bacterium]
MSRLIHRLIGVLVWTRYATHIVTSMVLVFATGMLGIYLFYEIIEAAHAHSLIEGFLRSLTAPEIIENGDE